METKEKAKELVLLFTNHYISCPHTRIKIAKEYALICVDREIKMLSVYLNQESIKTFQTSQFFIDITELEEVKKEIEKL